ncbi:MAG: Abi family protein [Firmicutes bacterium]|nr:Abi family protein [Bacillota bacterium]
MQKKFLSFEDQIKYLKDNKNLLISDFSNAQLILEKYGYFSLIGGYKTPFKNPTTQKYKDGTKFEDILHLYLFDENLRALFLKHLLQIERHIRSLLSYYFTEKYGKHQQHYLSPCNFTQNPKYKTDVNRLILTLHHLATKNSDYPYINHQRNKYHNVPLWVLVNGLTFGSLSKFYSYLTSDLQSKVAKHYTSVNRKQLEQYLSVLTKFRNVCAHNERLFSYKTRNDIPDTLLHQKLCIEKKGTQYSCGKHDLFSLVIAFRYLLDDIDFRLFKTQLNVLIRKYLSSSSTLSPQELYDYMGFPVNWTNITRYKK